MVNLFSQTFEPEFWDYFEFSPHISPVLKANGKDTFELFIKVSALLSFRLTSNWIYEH